LNDLTNGVENAEVTVFNVIPESELETSVRYDNKHFEEIFQFFRDVIERIIKVIS
jgi:universal stress protein G